VILCNLRFNRYSRSNCGRRTGTASCCCTAALCRRRKLHVMSCDSFKCRSMCYCQFANQFANPWWTWHGNCTSTVHDIVFFCYVLLLPWRGCNIAALASYVCSVEIGLITPYMLMMRPNTQCLECGWTVTHLFSSFDIITMTTCFCFPSSTHRGFHSFWVQSNW